jgi:P27 family predicted phage terminase small subunit
MRKMADEDPATCGLTIKTRGNPVPNPLVNVAEKAAAAMVKYAAEFGLTPAARSRVSTAGSGATESKFGPLLVG